MPLDLAAPPAAPETRPTRAEGIAAALAEAITRGETLNSPPILLGSSLFSQYESNRYSVQNLECRKTHEGL